MVVILTVVIVANVIRDERLKKKYIFGQFIFWNETTTYFEKSLRSILIFWDITHFETFFYFGPIAILLLVHCVCLYDNEKSVTTKKLSLSSWNRKRVQLINFMDNFPRAYLYVSVGCFYLWAEKPPNTAKLILFICITVIYIWYCVG